MKRILFSLLLICSVLISTNVIGQYYNVAFTKGTGNSLECRLISTNIGITTSQTMGFGVVNSWTNTAPGGTYTAPLDVFSFGQYWVTPTLFNPMSISINAGYTGLVHNPHGYDVSLRLALEFMPGSLQPIVFWGPYTTIPAFSDATLFIPAGSCTYTATPPTISSFFDANGFPTPVSLILAD